MAKQKRPEIYCWLCDKTKPAVGLCCNGTRRPPIYGKAGEDKARLQADRVKAEWRAPITTTVNQRSLEGLPLFATGREEQRGLFE